MKEESMEKLKELDRVKARLYEELEVVGKEQKRLSTAVHQVQREQKKELDKVEEFVADDPLTLEDVERWADSVFWKFARTMASSPHEYALRKSSDEGMFERVVEFLWTNGYDRRGFGRIWRSLDVGAHYLWICTRPEPGMPAPVGETILINRAPHPHEEATRQPKLSDGKERE